MLDPCTTALVRAWAGAADAELVGTSTCDKIISPPAMAPMAMATIAAETQSRISLNLGFIAGLPDAMTIALMRHLPII